MKNTAQNLIQLPYLERPFFRILAAGIAKEYCASRNAKGPQYNLTSFHVSSQYLIKLSSWKVHQAPSRNSSVYYFCSASAYFFAQSVLSLPLSLE